MEFKVYDIDKNIIILNDEIGSGAEAKVYSVDTNYVAKIYKEKITENQELKLKSLVKKNLQYEGICFPKKLLFNEKNLCVGYVMLKAKVKKKMELQNTVFNPNLLSSKFPLWTRLNLISMSETILNKVKFLHDSNILLGDWNPKNFLIASEHEIYFVDTDSYQVDNLPSPVGSTLFTPPELQDAGDFESYLRTKEHEYFSLATLLFMIFLPGKSPYAFQGGGEIKDNIKAMNFSYPLGDEDNYKAPQGIWEFIWNEMSYDMRRFFHSVFKEKARLNIDDWLNALNSFRIDIETGYTPNDIIPKSDEKILRNRTINMNRQDINDKDINLRIGKTDLKPKAKGENIGVLELSTKAVKFLTANQSEVLNNGFDFNSFFRQSDKTETGRGLDENNAMDMEYFNTHVLPSIRKMIKFSRDRNVDTLYSVATAAYRTALNREEIIERIREVCGVNVKILKKKEEALATLTAFIFSRDKNLQINPNQNVIMIDQGGGSTEISLFKGQELIDTYSLNLGTTVLKTVLFKEANKSTTLKKAFRDSEKLIKDRLKTYYSSPNSKILIRDKANFLVANGTAVTQASGKKGNAQQHCTRITLEQLKNKMEKLDEFFFQKYQTTEELLAEIEQPRSPYRDTMDGHLVCRLGIPMFIEIMSKFNLSEIIVNGTGLWYGIYFQNLYKLNN